MIYQLARDIYIHFEPEERGFIMIRLNPDEEHVKTIKEALEANDGYCPCAFEKTEDTKCMCKEFRECIKNPEFTGECHCGLYVKE